MNSQITASTKNDDIIPVSEDIIVPNTSTENMAKEKQSVQPITT